MLAVRSKVSIKILPIFAGSQTTIAETEEIWCEMEAFCRVDSTPDLECEASICPR